MGKLSFQPVQMGGFVRNISVGRANVAQGTKGRAVLVDPNPRAIYLAFDNVNKCSVLADADSVIKYKLNPRTYYVFLLARLNTDMKGTQVGNEIVIEYLRLSESVYQDFVDAYNEMPSVSSIILKPVVKKGNNGQDFSYVSPVPSKDEATDEVYDKIDKLDVEALWQLVQLDLGKTVEEYEALLELKPVQGEEARRIESRSSGTADVGRRRIGSQSQGEAPAQGRRVQRDLKNPPHKVEDAVAEEVPADLPDDLPFNEEDPFGNEPDDFQ
jgi:hypothetical protein